jgi:integrase
MLTRTGSDGKQLTEAFETEGIRHRRTKRMREQAWLIMIMLQDCGMRPDEVFPMRIENLRWDTNRIWIPEGETEKARRFVAMSERVKAMLRQWCGEGKEGRVFHPLDHAPAI